MSAHNAADAQGMGGNGRVETCAICTGTPYESVGFDHDLRTLRLSNGYALDEGTDRLRGPSPGGGQYEVRTCKDCRGDFIEMLWSWLRGDSLHLTRVADSPDRNIPVRQAGRTVMMTRPEWDAERQPVRDAIADLKNEMALAECDWCGKPAGEHDAYQGRACLDALTTRSIKESPAYQARDSGRQVTP